MFVVEVPDVFSQVFVMKKNSKRFSKSGGWGLNQPYQQRSAASGCVAGV
jgi:hypothetical protein